MFFISWGLAERSCLKLVDWIARRATQVRTPLAGSFPLKVHQKFNRMGSNWSFRTWVGIRVGCLCLYLAAYGDASRVGVLCVNDIHSLTQLSVKYVCTSMTRFSGRVGHVVKSPRSLLEYLLKTKIHIQLVRWGCLPLSHNSLNDTSILGVFWLFAPPSPNPRLRNSNSP